MGRAARKAKGAWDSARGIFERRAAALHGVCVGVLARRFPPNRITPPVLRTNLNTFLVAHGRGSTGRSAECSIRSPPRDAPVPQGPVAPAPPRRLLDHDGPPRPRGRGSAARPKPCPKRGALASGGHRDHRCASPPFFFASSSPPSAAPQAASERGVAAQAARVGVTKAAACSRWPGAGSVESQWAFRATRTPEPEEHRERGRARRPSCDIGAVDVTSWVILMAGSWLEAVGCLPTEACAPVDTVGRTPHPVPSPSHERGSGA